MTLPAGGARPRIAIIAGLSLLAGCLDAGEGGDPAADAGSTAVDARPWDGAPDRRPDAPPPVTDARPFDARPTSDSASSDSVTSEAAPDAPGGPTCQRPPADQPWIRGYQDELVARLAGARPLPAGGMLGVRRSAGARALTRQFLVQQLGDLGLTGRLHDYGSGQNVYAQLMAEAGAEDWVVLGAHFDTVAGSPGANDNASGLAAVLSVARHLQAIPCRSRNVMFVLFDEEEDGLLGSAAFARKLKADGVKVHSVHTIDQMGWDMDGDRRIEVELPDRGLRELYVAGAADLGWSEPERAIIATNVSSTDHASFRPDFPAVGLTEEYRSGDTTPHYHRPTDTYPTVDFDYLKSTTVLLHHVFTDLVAASPRFVSTLPRPQAIPRRPDEIELRPHGPRPPLAPASR